MEHCSSPIAISFSRSLRRSKRYVRSTAFRRKFVSCPVLTLRSKNFRLKAELQTYLSMQPFDFYPRTRLIFGEGSFERLGALASELGFRRTLLVADKGILACGYVDRASK